MSLPQPAEPNGTPVADAVREIPATPEWIARCEMLQARIEALEQQVEALMVSPRTRASLLPERLHDFRPASREPLMPDAPPERREVFRTDPPAAEAASCGVLAGTFHPPTPEIGLLIAAGDAAARRLAETLGGILAGAGWKVRGLTEGHSAAHGCGGLTLIASPALPLQRVTNTLNALREAGFAMTYQLDPERSSGETVLIVAPAAAPENNAGPTG